MYLPLTAPPKSHLNASPVVELRQYTLKPGKRDTLIGIFDTHLVEGQENAGMTIIGQFRDLDRPDMFVWMRGFDGMEARRNALTAFYDGPVWAAYSNAANETMIDSDNVLQLKPAWPGAGFDLSGSQRAVLPPSGHEDVGQEKTSTDNRLRGLVVLTIHHLPPGTETEFAENFQIGAVPVLTALGARVRAAFITEHAENSFPRLPVRLGESVFVSVTGFDSAEAHARHEAALAASPAWQAFQQAAQSGIAEPTETLRLSATSQSLLR
ncbi:NIPSNAP family protein [Mesorhizobium sp. AR10]|uniref:NIPSNAP family protein n=1 Tax=Mesorhizobium sp. AR10 TaxID=2865839 RepID=UPI00215EDE32|nr:NIPSNAP family protein [Mesorhizobium sp. AR10]